MKKAGKTIAKIIAAIVVVVIVVIAGVFFWIDGLAKAGVEGGATYALGVDTRLGGMDVGVLAGRVAMDALTVANPAGYESANFLEMGEGRVGVSLGSLMEDNVVLPELTLSGIRLKLEHREGKANYKAIMDNLKKFESGEKKDPEEKSEGGKTFVIKRVAIKDVHVEAELLPIGGSLTRVPVDIDEIVLENVGTGPGGGVKLAELTNILLKAILKGVVDKAGNLLPGDIAGELTAGLDQLKDLGNVSVQVVGEVTSKVAKEAEEAVEKAAEEVTKAVDEGAKKAGEELDKAGKELEKGIGGLLGKDKKKDKD